jgi:putative acetyltransferase
VTEAPSVRVEVVQPDDPALLVLVDELSSLLAARYGSSGRDGFDPSSVDPRTVVVVACIRAVPVGCGAVRPLDEIGGPRVAEIKRMYARPGTRGVGRSVLAALEDHALAQGRTTVWLETRRANARAVAFYRRAGYAERGAYGKYVGRPEAICMEKRLAAGV